MNIRLDAVTVEMLKAVMKQKRQSDPQKFLTAEIKKMYLAL